MLISGKRFFDDTGLKVKKISHRVDGVQRKIMIKRANHGEANESWRGGRNMAE